MAIVLGKHPEQECSDSIHFVCEGFRLDIRSTLIELGAKVPEPMMTARDGVLIKETLCSCSCHDRAKLREADEPKFRWAYNSTIEIWEDAVRYGSEREGEDKEFVDWTIKVAGKPGIEK